MEGKERFEFGGEELSKVFKVFAWTVASALIVLAIDALGMIEVPAQYAFAVPLANTALYAIKEWVADNRE